MTANWMNTLSLGLLTLALSAGAQAKPAAATVAGTWQFNVSVQGVDATNTCTLEQTGETLSGECVTETGKQKATGSVKDGAVHIVHDGNYQGSPYTMSYDGKLSADGIMSGAVDVSPFGVSGTFLGKQVPATSK